MQREQSEHSRNRVELDGVIVRGRYLRGLSPGELYVDPITGILCRVLERRPAWKRARTKPVAVGDEKLRRIDGLWYWILFADVLAPTRVEGVVINHRGVDIITGKEIAYPGRYRAGKRQANRRDLRRYGVRNTAV